MIPIKRTEEPEIFRSKAVKTERNKLVERFNDQTAQARMQFNMAILSKIKPVLLEMCSHKCAYCESTIGIVSSGTIEHYRPKSGARGLKGEYHKDHYWWLSYDWENCLIACEVCNSKKRNYFPLENEKKRAKINDVGKDLRKEKPLLLNPCFDQPDDHFNFLENGKLAPLTERGEVTIKLIGLNRKNLVAQRKRAISNFKLKLRQLALLPGGDLYSEDAQLMDEIRQLLSDKPPQAYAGTLRSIYNTWLSEQTALNVETEKNIQETNQSRPRSLPNQFSMKGLSKPKASPKQSVQKKMSKLEQEKVLKVRATYKRLKQFSIKSIEIKNFKSINHLKLDLNNTHSEDGSLQESWLLILGDNGIGKSSILQAIALCLMGRTALDKQELDVLQYLKRGEKNGFIKIKGHSTNSTILLEFDEQGFKTKRASPVCFTVGYGSTRLLPKGNIQPYPYKEPYINIKNLFDYSYSLENPNLWLSEISTKEFDDRVAPALIDLLLLDGDDKLSFEEDKVYITHLNEKHLLEHMSDGFRSIAGLALDLMKTLSIDQADFHHATGVVLIDEIGSHLHPRWKVKIVRALKKTFPNLQFIVTSHEPLCLRGIEKGEVGVLVRNNNREVQILDASVLSDHTVMSIEQLITSDLFGLLDVYDENVVRTYEEYYELLSKPVKTEKEKERLSTLSETISVDKMLLGATKAQQAHYELLQKNFVKEFVESGFKTKQALKEKTKEQAKSLIDKKNLNWL